MGRGYTQIGLDERKLLWRLWEGGAGVREISRELLRAPSTISRELTRNEYSRESRPVNCHYKAQRRRRESYRKPRLKSKELQAEVIRRLKDGHSPEQIAGRLVYEGAAETVCHESIYQFIYKERPDLRQYLCRRHGQRKRFRQSKKTKRAAPLRGRISIAERPAHIETREQAGHWECDLAISKKSPPALQVIVERKTRFSVIRKSPDKSAPQVTAEIIGALKRYPPALRRTLTYDNGAENAGHRNVNRKLKTTSYFCDPYHPWQKGTVENTVGIIRRHFPKGTDFLAVSDRTVRRLQDKLNNRPRKCLGFKTPNEAMTYERVALHC